MIKLPFKELMGNFSLISSHFVSQCLKIEQINKDDSFFCDPSKNNWLKNFCEISLFIEWTYLDTTERRSFATDYLCRKIYHIKHVKNKKKEIIKDKKTKTYNYTIDNNNYNSVIGLYIYTDKNNKNIENIKDIEILFNNKLYTFDNCKIINNQLLYLTFDYFENMNTIDKNIVINSKVDNLCCQMHYFNILSYHNGMHESYFEIFGICEIEKMRNEKYNICYNINEPIVIKKIGTQKVKNYINIHVDQSCVKSIDEEITIMRLFNCSIDSNIIIPIHINILILEKCNTDFTSIPLTIQELWLIKSKKQTNLHSGISKLKILNKNDTDGMKIPFNCQIDILNSNDKFII
jgi:hypothetical protein